MRQLSLLDDDRTGNLAGLVPALRAAMNRTAGVDEEGRKLLVDRINSLASAAGIRLTAGNARSVSKDTLDKWLSPGDRDHTPSILAVCAFCLATKTAEPLRVLLRAIGLDVMDQEDQKLRDYGRACLNARAAAKKKRKLEEEI